MFLKFTTTFAIWIRYAPLETARLFLCPPLFWCVAWRVFFKLVRLSKQVERNSILDKSKNLPSTTLHGNPDFAHLTARYFRSAISFAPKEIRFRPWKNPHLDAVGKRSSTKKDKMNDSMLTCFAYILNLPKLDVAILPVCGPTCVTYRGKRKFTHDGTTWTTPQN